MSQAIQFTEEQMRAIDHSKGHLRIIACPGSGKTEVVSQRVARLIEGGVEPKSIVAFTFTEKAAEQLKTRIRGILEARCPNRADFGDMYVGTIHAFCFYMLKEIDPTFRSYDVLDDPMRVAFLSKYQTYYKSVGLDKLEEEHNFRHYQTIYKFIEAIDIITNEDIDPSDLSDKVLAKCYKSYRSTLVEEKYFDFSTIIHTFVTVFREDRRKLALLHERVKHVILDEYQDVNSLQEALLAQMSDGADSVCVVGDDDQNIYYWRGSDVKIIREFGERYGKKFRVTDVNLGTNFRSTDSIIHTASSLIEHNTRRLPKKMISNIGLERRYQDGDIVHMHFEDDEEEFGFMVEKIRELHGTDFLDKRNRPFSLSYGDFAVLVRTNEDAARTVSYLDRSGIPCITKSGGSVFDRPEVSLAMDSIGYVFGCRGYTIDAIPSIPDLEGRYSETFSQFPHADAKKFASKLKNIRKQADDLLEKSPKDYFPDLGLQGFYYKILNAMGSEDFDFGDVFNYNLASLSCAISDYESVWIRLRASEVIGFFFFVFSYARMNYVDTQHSDSTIIDAVNVLTIHKAKGLEFPVVFMPNFERKMKRMNRETLVDLDLYDYAKYNGDEEDDRRVYYTAITRSEKYLYMTGSKKQDNKIKSNYVPHPLLEEIDKRYFSSELRSKRPRSGYPSRVATAGVYPTSFSNLASYGRCPQDFRMRNIFGYNAGVPVTFGYGTNIHNALNVIHKNYIRSKKIPTDGEIEEVFDRMFKLRYATKKIAENMKKSAIKAVKNYVVIHKNDFGRILETEKNFEFVLNGALISGQIDLLKRVDENNRVTEVEIIDFKTERKDGVYSVDHEKQLRFYAIACLDSLGIKPEKAYIHHIDDHTKTYADISPKKLEETKVEISGQVSEILERRFPSKPEKKRCQDCDYAMICPYKEFAIGIASSGNGKVPEIEGGPVTVMSSEQSRLGKQAIEKAKRLSNGGVVRVDGNMYKVRSGSDPSKWYVITDMKCTCIGFRKYSVRHGGAANCSHVEAVRLFTREK